MFITHNKIRMHDTDMAGILYFPRQFRFAHEALEDFVESEGLSFEQVFKREDFVFVIVHAEADYFTSLKVGDNLEVHLGIERLGNTSFTVFYQIYRKNSPTDKELVGSVKTVHVTLERISRKKIPIPTVIRAKFAKYLIPSVT